MGNSTIALFAKAPQVLKWVGKVTPNSSGTNSLVLFSELQDSWHKSIYFIPWHLDVLDGNQTNSGRRGEKKTGPRSRFQRSEIGTKKLVLEVSCADPAPPDTRYPRVEKVTRVEDGKILPEISRNMVREFTC